MSNLTIVMYHYVRPIIGSEFPNIKGLEFEGFKRQLDYFQQRFNIVTVEEIIYSIKNQKKLVDNACWLTFDDGYKDHFKYVLPELLKRNLQGSFFPPKEAIVNDIVLDVNLIHHILAKCDDFYKLRMRLEQLCELNSIQKIDLKKFWDIYGVANRFDDRNIIYIKRILQHALPEDIRKKIINILFNEYVGISEKKLSSMLYMSIDEIKHLVNSGMHVGVHGAKHYWMNRLNIKGQELEIQESLNFIKEISSSTKDWIMCYPYGAYNSDTLSLLKKYGAIIGITADVTTEAKVREANLVMDNLLTLPRFDTNDFPQ